MSTETPTAVTTPPRTGGVVSDDLWPLSVEQYHAMIAGGILGPDDPIEFLEGCLVRKMPKNPEHCAAVEDLRELLTKLIGAAWHVRTQDPIALAGSEPEPDVAVVVGARTSYRTRHPGAADIGLIAEAAESTLSRDREWKRRIYARAGIPVYLLVNLTAREITVFTEPNESTSEPDYVCRVTYRQGDSVPVTLAGVLIGQFEVSRILP